MRESSTNRFHTGLLDLIMSMTGPEKRFFQDYAKSRLDKRDHLFLQLFDGYRKLNSKNDEPLRLQFFEGKSRGYFSVIKNELKELILESLRKFNSPNSIHQKISIALANTEIFYGKGLTVECEKELNKAMKLIEKYEYGHKYFEAAYWYKRIMFLRGYSDKTEKLLAEVHNRELYYTEKIASETSYQLLSEKIYHMAYAKGFVSDEKANAIMESYFNDPLLKDEEMAKSLSAKSQFYNLKTKEAELHSDSSGLAHWNGKLLHMLEVNDEFRSSHPLTYVHTVYNQIMALISLGDRKASAALIGNLKSPEFVKNKGLSSKMKRPIEVFRLNAVFSQGLAFLNFSTINRVLEQQGDLLLKTEEPTYQFVYTETYYLICVSLVLQKKYKEAVHWVNKILANGQIDQRIDILSSIRIANLIIHYELHHDVFLHYKLESVARYLRKHKELKEKEHLLLKFIKVLVNINRTKERQAKMVGIYEEYAQLEEQTKNLLQFTYLNVRLWMKSKIENSDFLNLNNEELRSKEDGFRNEE